MSDKKLTELITEASLATLKEHLSLYALDDIAHSIAGDTIVGDGKINLGSNFLNSTATTDCTIFQNNGDFLFSIKASAEQNQFAKFFPQMLPDNRWGVIDADEHPFLSLQAVEVEGISWDYIYFSTSETVKQQLLWNGKGSAGNPTIESLKQISGKELDLNDEPLPWKGGLFFSGSYNMPWNTIFPPEIPWQEFIPTTPVVPVKGCVYQQGAMSFIKLTVNLVSKASPFGGDVIKNIALAFEFSSAFADPADSAAFSRERRIGLSGTIQIGAKSEMNLVGSWPLDGNEILIGAKCSFDDINSYFSKDSIAVSALPESVAASLIFTVSKDECRIDKIAFGLHIEEWSIVPNVFTLTSVDFGLRIFSPVTVNLLMADFTAKATIGSTKFICTGQYPAGIYYLGLDPETPVKLGELIGSITGTSGLFSSDLLLNELSGTYNAGAEIYDVACTVSFDQKWDAGPKQGVQLQNISAKLRGAKDNLFCSLKADFSIAYTNSQGIQAMNFDVQCIYSGSWFFSASYAGDISLADVGSAMGFGNIPALLSKCQLNALSLYYDSGGNVTFATKSTITIDGTSWETDLLIDKRDNEFDFSGKFIYKANDLDFACSFAYSKENGKSWLLFGLNLEIAGVVIKLIATSKNEDSTTGTVKDREFKGGAQNLNLSIIDVIKSLTNTNFEKPDWLPDIVITEIACTHDSSSGTTTLSAKAKALPGEHEVQFVFYKENAQEETQDKKKRDARHAFGLITDDVSLGGLPVVGDVLREVAIKNLGFVYTSKEGKYELPACTPAVSDAAAGDTSAKKDDTADKNADIERGVKYQKGFNFTGNLHLPAGNHFSLAVAAKDKNSNDNTPSSEPAVPAQSNNVPTKQETFQPDIKWVDLNKKLGPVTIDKVGFEINEGRLGLLVTADVAMGPLIFSLTALGISFTISKLFKAEFDPSFSLGGLGLLYNAPPVEIGGSFLKVTVQDTDVDGNKTYRDEYNGTAIIKATDFTLSALGSYTKVNGDVSLFVYAYLEKAIGGPSFFYVEGLALGFGYNRSIVMPDVTEVAHYPLVAQVMAGKDPTSNKTPAQVLTDELASLHAYLPVDPGEIFLAIGIKFNTFKIIDSFALLAISFGNHTEIDVLGQSNIVVPAPLKEEGKTAPPPLAEIKILLVAKFLPDEGFLSVVAQLSTDSYIFSKDCHLTGGAAFYSWFKGEHEGDFVVTMGGYHPHFTIPAHYPQVPRLALNWQITSKMSIKGDMYFALCPHAFMAGGHLEALYSDGDFKAWFKAGADFLITWQPYHYEASIYLDIGASLHVDLLFTSFTVTVEYGADVEIWGPEFSGRATVHIYCFDITIRFGPSDTGELKPIEWDAFVATSLPEPAKTLSISVTSGEHGKDVFGEGEKKITYPVINPKELEFIAETFIPVNTFDDAVTARLNGTANANMLQGFGIAPMDKKNTDILSKLAVSIYYNEDEPTFDKTQSIPDNLVISMNTKKMPASIWGNEFKHDLNEKQKLLNVVNGLRFVTKEPLQTGEFDYPDLKELFEMDNLPVLLKWQELPKEPVKIETAATTTSNLKSLLGL